VLTPALDKLDQIFEIIVQGCRNEFQTEFHETFDCVINVAAHEFYDSVSLCFV